MTAASVEACKTLGARDQRVSVRLQHVTSSYWQPLPPEGQEASWREQLKRALGTTSDAYLDATLVQIQNASRLPCGGISETSVNAVLAFIEAAAPKDEVEASLAVQMACTHAVTMAVLSRLGGGFGGDRQTAMMAAAASRLMRAFATQVEALRRLKHGSSQLIRIEHIHMDAGAQAVFGSAR